MTVLKSLRSIAAGATLAASLVGAASLQAETTLRIHQVGDLGIIDPIVTTATPTRDMAYMIWDTLFAMDADFKVQPQMVGAYEISEDGKTYTLTLRDGLKWSDGADVTPADCIASLKRWMLNDSMGKILAERLTGMEVVDDATFTLVLSEPFGMTLQLLGKPGAYVPFMMPERLAANGPNDAITEYIGSGPYMMDVDAWIPGSKVVYVKNPHYVPRDEPPSFLAGGKIAKVDRVERITFSDGISVVNALMSGDLDYSDEIPTDLLPMFEGNENVRQYVRDNLGESVQIVLNHKIAPTDNLLVRQAIQLALGQDDFMLSVYGDRDDFYQICPAIFFCGTPLETDINSERVMKKDPEAARALLKEAGYDGTPVFVIHDADLGMSDAYVTVLVQSLRKAGFEVEDFVTDTSTKFSRRANRGPVSEGGWNIFWTGWGGLDQMNPLTNVYTLGACDDGWFGWPCDEQLQELRREYLHAPDTDTQFAIAEKIQTRVNEIVTFIPMGQYASPVVESTKIHGMIPGPVATFWNVSKDE